MWTGYFGLEGFPKGLFWGVGFFECLGSMNGCGWGLFDFHSDGVKYIFARMIYGYNLILSFDPLVQSVPVIIHHD